MMISLVGYKEVPVKEPDWHVWDNEMDDYMIDFFRHIEKIDFLIEKINQHVTQPLSEFRRQYGGSHNFL